MKRVIVSVTNDISTDQRVHKVCTTLKQMNYDVTVIGRKLKNSIPLNRNYKTVRFNLFFNKGVLFYAEYNLSLFLKLLFVKKDILLANDLDTLLPNYLVSKVSNTTLVYDSHELFTEVPELVNRPAKQKIWLNIENKILPNLKNCYTVCNSISNYYNLKYNTSFKVIKNVPFSINNVEKGSFPFSTENEKVIIYQGALNIGRGLELIIDTIPFIDNALLVIIGSGDIESLLYEKVRLLNLENKVKFISKKEPQELKKLTALADLGLSIEEDLGLNYRYALPNKLFDYIQAEVPVLVSNLTEMKSVVEEYKIGEIVNSRNPELLAKQITAILEKGKTFYMQNLQAARKELTWENESEKLIDIFKNLE